MNMREESLLTANSPGQQYINAIARQIIPEYSMQFDNGKEVVAKLSWGTGVMVVDGNIEPGAETFFNFVKHYFDKYIDEEVKRRTVELEDKLYMAKMQNDLYKSAVDDF